ncbi:hypothetical protein ES703_77897 [subsurface metagenome]
MINCKVTDCKHNDRKKDLCKLASKDIALNDVKSCQSYVKDMEYLREMWGHGQTE